MEGNIATDTPVLVLLIVKYTNNMICIKCHYYEIYIEGNKDFVMFGCRFEVTESQYNTAYI